MQAGFYLASCLLMWGLATYAMKVAGQRLDPFTTVVFNVIGYALTLVFILPQARLSLSLTHVLAAGIGILFVIGNLAFYKLSQTQHVSVLAPITGLYIVIPVVLGFVVLHEPLTWRKAVGILLAMSAIYLLSSSDE